MKTVTFNGNAFEVQRQAAAWKAANPNVRLMHDGAPVAAGDSMSLYDHIWALTIRYEESEAK